MGHLLNYFPIKLLPPQFYCSLMPSLISDTMNLIPISEPKLTTNLLVIYLLSNEVFFPKEHNFNLILSLIPIILWLNHMNFVCNISKHSKKHKIVPQFSLLLIP